MKTCIRIILCIVITGCLLILWPVFAVLTSTTINAFSANMVKIKSEFKGATDEKRGFGLIMLEKDDYLYVITPKHVIEDKEAHPAQDNISQAITVTLYRADQSIPAAFIRKHDRLDIALLKVKKPEGFIWSYAKLGGQVDKDGRVWVLGYDWQWQLKPDATPIFANYVDISEIRATTTVKEGSSGGLLITDDFITGMIIENNQEKNLVTAYRFDFISNIVLEQWLNEELKPDIYDNQYPYIDAGINPGLAIVLTSADEKTPPITYGAGFYIDYIASSTWGVRYTHNEYKIKTEVEWPLGNESIKFRNSVSLDMLLLLLGNDMSNTPYIRQTEGIIYFYLGYGIGKHNPEVNINSAGWTRLDAQSSFTESYSDTFNIYTLGATYSEYFSANWSYGLDLGFMFTDDAYIAVDVNKPFNSNSMNDFFLCFNLKISYAFGRQSAPKLKVLY